MREFNDVHGETGIQVRSWTSDDGRAAVIVTVPAGLSETQREGVAGGLTIRALSRLYREDATPAQSGEMT